MSQQQLEKLYTDTVENFNAWQELKSDPAHEPYVRALGVAVKGLAESTVEYALLEDKILENKAAIQKDADAVSPYVN